MKIVIALIGFVFLLIAGLSTPAGVVFGIYSWAVSGVELPMALWLGAKLWLTMLGVGILIGLPCHVIANID